MSVLISVTTLLVIAGPLSRAQKSIGHARCPLARHVVISVDITISIGSVDCCRRVEVKGEIEKGDDDEDYVYNSRASGTWVPAW